MVTQHKTKRYITVQDAVDRLTVSERTIRRWIREDKLHSIRDTTGHLHIDLDDIECLIKSKPPLVQPLREQIQAVLSQVAQLQARGDEQEQQIHMLSHQVEMLLQHGPSDSGVLARTSSEVLIERQRRTSLSSLEKRHLPPETLRLVHFAKQHQIDSSQCKQLFWSREIPLTIYQRPGTIQRNKQEWWITLEQHRTVATYLQQHHISFTACPLCDQEDTLHHEIGDAASSS